MTTVLDQRHRKITVIMHQNGTVSVNGEVIGKWRKEELYPTPRWVLITPKCRGGYGTTRGLRHAAVDYYLHYVWPITPITA